MQIVNNAGFAIRILVGGVPQDLLFDGKPVTVDDAYRFSENFRMAHHKGWVKLYEPAPKVSPSAQEVEPEAAPEQRGRRRKRGKSQSPESL